LSGKLADAGFPKARREGESMKGALLPKAALAVLVILCVAAGLFMSAEGLRAARRDEPAQVPSAAMAEPPASLSAGGSGALFLQGPKSAFLSEPLSRQLTGKAAAYRVYEPARVITARAAAALEIAADAGTLSIIRCVMDKDGKK